MNGINAAYAASENAAGGKIWIMSGGPNQINHFQIVRGYCGLTTQNLSFSER